MPKPKTVPRDVVWIARTDTRHYAWCGLGRTRDEAIDALLDAFHAKVGTPYPEFFEAEYRHPFSRDEIDAAPYRLGRGYRDWEPDSDVAEPKTTRGSRRRKTA